MLNCVYNLVLEKRVQGCGLQEEVEKIIKMLWPFSIDLLQTIFYLPFFFCSALILT
jgi:hypothetical protein